jgi:tRNA(fMet)-specific endonuclease VapC
VPVLDTDILTIIQMESEPRYSRVRRRLEALPPETQVWVTIITFEEQVRGWLTLIKRAKPQDLSGAYVRLQALLQEFNIRPMLMFDDAAARILQGFSRSLRVSEMDRRIAAIAMSHDEVLISSNVADFGRIPGLRVEDWGREDVA